MEQSISRSHQTVGRRGIAAKKIPFSRPLALTRCGARGPLLFFATLALDEFLVILSAHFRVALVDQLDDFNPDIPTRGPVIFAELLPVVIQCILVIICGSLKCLPE